MGFPSKIFPAGGERGEADPTPGPCDTRSDALRGPGSSLCHPDCTRALSPMTATNEALAQCLGRPVGQAAELSRLWGSMTNFFAAPLSKSL